MTDISEIPINQRESYASRCRSAFSCRWNSIWKSTCISKDARVDDYAYNGHSILLCDRDFLSSSSITDRDGRDVARSVFSKEQQRYYFVDVFQFRSVGSTEKGLNIWRSMMKINGKKKRENGSDIWNCWYQWRNYSLWNKTSCKAWLVTPRGRCSLEKSSALQTASSVSPYRSISETISST